MVWLSKCLDLIIKSMHLGALEMKVGEAASVYFELAAQCGQAAI